MDQGLSDLVHRPSCGVERYALGKKLDEADSISCVAAEENAVRIGRIDVDATRILLRKGQRELGKLARCRIEPEDLVDLLSAYPDNVALLVRDH